MRAPTPTQQARPRPRPRLPTTHALAQVGHPDHVGGGVGVHPRALPLDHARLLVGAARLQRLRRGSRQEGHPPPRQRAAGRHLTPARRRQLRTSLHRHHRLFLWDEEGHSTAPCGLAYDLTLHALCQRAARLPATAKTGNEALSADLDLRGAAFRGLPHHDEPRCLGLCAHSAARQGRGARVARVVHLDVRARSSQSSPAARGRARRGRGGGVLGWYSPALGTWRRRSGAL